MSKETISGADDLLVGQARVLEQIVRGEPLPDVLASLCAMVEQHAEAPVRAAILLVDDDGRRLRAGAGPSLPADYSAAVDGVGIDPELGTCARAAATGQIVVTPDIAACARWEPIRHLPLGLGMVAAWSMPIMSSENVVLGTFGTYFFERREPRPLERHLVEVLARTAALAIERARADRGLRERARRHELLSRLESTVRSLGDPAELRSVTARVLAEHLDVDRCAHAVVEDELVLRVMGEHARGDLPSIVGRWDLAALGPVCAEALRAGESLVVEDSDADDPDGTIVELNLTAAGMLGRHRGELVGRRLSASLTKDARRALADHLARCRAEPGRVTSELSLRARGQDRIVQVVSEPIGPPDDRAPAYRTSFVDITARKQRELDLHLLLQVGDELGRTLDHRRILDVAVGAVVPRLADLCIIDLVRETEEVERAVVAAADPSDAALADRLRGAGFGPHQREVQAAVLASCEPVLLREITNEIREQIAGDHRQASILRALDVRSMVVVPVAARGRVLGALTLAVGASGRRYDHAHLEITRALADRIAFALDNARLYRQAQQAIAARDSTLAVVSHDLRSPLGVILMHAELLVYQARESGRADELGALEAISRSAGRMGRMIQDLVDAASIEVGQLRVRRSRQPLTPIVTDAVEALRATAAARSCTIDCDLPVDAPADVDCDRDRIVQVLGNLIGNALKFSPPSGRIVVRVVPDAGEIRVAVADHGRGIAPEDLPHIFERYWRARDTAHLGSGLGLGIAKGIIEAHHGRIWVESTLGVGSTFWFALPIAAEVRAPAESPPRGPVASASQAPKTVLVVDDDADVRDVVGDVLARRGYQVAKASNGAEALTCARREPAPAAIVLDIAMPVMDGWAFFAERERDSMLREIPVVVMSGQRDVADRVHAFHAGYLAKPIHTERLLDEVAHAIG